ncbi:SCO family protein [Enterovirga rhinocerotis]|uniref:Protein SCO1/2 n=1 Tax=Enterovirga rhinocerotis TaxID=1339210 RepID=A0A4R7BXY5_9HYPH|nr:SCO family protein [Enterovirga rhinocerotis]TDR90461.1 protein SCO1/2 [Enterovirga rhinocerotis]
MTKAARIALAVLCALNAAVRPAEADGPERSAAELMDVLMWNREPVGGPFSLLGHDGRRHAPEEFRGKLMLVYFGFSYCPDICPTDLQEMSRAIELLGPAGGDIQPLFITVDPERDTAEHLKTYVSLFHPRLLGLTGSLDEIRRVARLYKASFQKADTPDGYTVDHSAYVYLMGRDGAYLGFFPPNTPAERMLTMIRPHLGPPGR